MTMCTDLVPRETLSAMVASYKLAAIEIAQAYTLLDEAQTRLRADFLDAPGYRFDTNPRTTYDRVGEKAIQAVMGTLKRDAWAVILQRMEIRKILSIKRREELDRQISSGEGLPEVSEENILAMFESAAAKVSTYLEEAVKEVFEYLRPPHSSFKTNTEFEIGKRVILSWMVEKAWNRGKFRPNYNREKYLTALDNVFQMLEGKGHVKTFHGQLYDAIIESADGSGETDYFKFRCYLNGNLHLEFKRLDLVAQLNAIAGGNRLKP